MARKLGQQEAAFMAYVQMRDLRTVRSGDLVAPLKLSAKQEQYLLSRMNRRGSWNHCDDSALTAKRFS